MQQAARSSLGVEWAGGMTREDANAYTRTADIGFSWRSQALDSTHELSTKVLEYCALGVAPVLNRIAAHVDLLGDDYPLFVNDDVASVEQAIIAVVEDPHLLDVARERATSAVGYFRMARAAERIGAAIAAAPKASSLSGARQVVPSAALVGEHLERARGVHAGLADIAGGLEVLDWSSRARGLEESRASELHSSEVVILDGAQPYLPWTTSRIEPTQTLIVRSAHPSTDVPLLRGPALDRVDAVVVETTSDRDALVRARPGLADRVHVVKPAVDTDYLDRPGLPGRQFRIGMLDLWPSSRRPDAAVRLLGELLAVDDRFSLHLRSSRPWEDPERWGQPGERDFYSALLDQVRADPLLRSRIGFEDEGADLPGWYRTIGWLFQPRRAGEALDLRALEAQAAGVVVVSPAEADAVEVFGPEQAFDDVASLAKFVLATTTSDQPWSTVENAARQRAAGHDVTVVRGAWDAVITDARARHA